MRPSRPRPPLAWLVAAAPGAAKPLPAADLQAIDQIVAQQMAATTAGS